MALAARLFLVALICSLLWSGYHSGVSSSQAGVKDADAVVILSKHQRNSVVIGILMIMPTLYLFDDLLKKGKAPPLLAK